MLYGLKRLLPRLLSKPFPMVSLKYFHILEKCLKSMLDSDSLASRGRTPEIMADAAMILFSQSSREYTYVQ